MSTDHAADPIGAALHLYTATPRFSLVNSILVSSGAILKAPRSDKKTVFISSSFSRINAVVMKSMQFLSRVTR